MAQIECDCLTMPCCTFLHAGHMHVGYVRTLVNNPSFLLYELIKTLAVDAACLQQDVFEKYLAWQGWISYSSMFFKGDEEKLNWRWVHVHPNMWKSNTYTPDWITIFWCFHIKILCGFLVCLKIYIMLFNFLLMFLRYFQFVRRFNKKVQKKEEDVTHNKSSKWRFFKINILFFKITVFLKWPL